MTHVILYYVVTTQEYFDPNDHQFFKQEVPSTTI